MSERSLFWVEAAEITSLLTRIDEPGSPRPATAATPVTPSAVDTSSTAEAAASASVTDSAALGLGELWLPEGSIEERLGAFLGWLQTAADSSEVFVADAEGLPLVSQGVGDALIATLASLGGVWGTLRLDCPELGPGRLAIDFADDRYLHLLATETRWGWLHLGLVTDRRLECPRIDRILEAFLRTVDTEGKEPP